MYMHKPLKRHRLTEVSHALMYVPMPSLLYYDYTIYTSVRTYTVASPPHDPREHRWIQLDHEMVMYKYYRTYIYFG